ncbi:MAG: hypothetical protein KAJ42_10315 [Gemmatimonadetes bacterium]|nr:hypothetical protein [Gemmatimonadota bacterium]
MLTKAQIRRLLSELEWETVYEDTREIRLQRRRPGYSKDAEIGGLQAALSIMLEATRE